MLYDLQIDKREHSVACVKDVAEFLQFIVMTVFRIVEAVKQTNL